MGTKLPQSTNSSYISMIGLDMPSMNIQQLGPQGSISLEDATFNSYTQPYVNFALIKAHGGTIVQCKYETSNNWEYHVIPDNVKNFDRELGKIISLFLMKK